MLFARLTLRVLYSTIAGNHVAGYSGDGGLATTAQLNKPSAIVCDENGNLYITDGENSVIRKINSSGIITTIAGNGTRGYSGDGGPTLSAELDLVNFMGIAIDKAGNLFISHPNKNVVRKVSATGIITTIAGNGSPGYFGDGGLATAAQLDQPAGLTVDKTGNVYIATSSSSVIRKVNISGIISTVAGTGSPGYSGDGGLATTAQLGFLSPLGLGVDVCDNIYVADYSNFVIRQIATSGIITTIAGNHTNGVSGNGGLPTSAQLWFPTGVAADMIGNIYIIDTYNNSIRKITPAVPAIIAQPQSVSICGSSNASFSIQANAVLGYKWQSIREQVGMI